MAVAVSSEANLWTPNIRSSAQVSWRKIGQLHVDSDIDSRSIDSRVKAEGNLYPLSHLSLNISPGSSSKTMATGQYSLFMSIRFLLRVTGISDETDRASCGIIPSDHRQIVPT